ncbi:MAG: twin-arginine translocase TatA/TatE family subunit [Anaerolineae bacterium]
MPTIGTTELLLVLGIVVLIFGTAKLPELGANLGRSIRGFRSAVSADGEPEETVQAKSDDVAAG